jgi:hypothetical protein
MDSLLGVIPRPKKALNEKELNSIVRICKLFNLSHPDEHGYVGLRAGVAACSYLWLSRSMGIESDVAELIVTSESNSAIRGIDAGFPGGIQPTSIQVHDDNYVVFSADRHWAFDLSRLKYVEYNPETAKPAATAALSLLIVVDRLLGQHANLLEQRKQNAERSNQRTDEDGQAVTGPQEDAGGQATASVGGASLAPAAGVSG